MKVQLWHSARPTSLHVVQIHDQIQVGSADDNTIVLAVSEVSRFHAVLANVEGRLQVTDQGSSTGTWVDGSRIEGPTWVERSVRIGPYRFELFDDRVIQPRDPDPRATPVGAPPRTNGHVRLFVGLEPPSARVVDLEKGSHHEITARHRVALLYFLARALAQDEDSKNGGWRSYEKSAVAVWGKPGLHNSNSKLSTLTYRIREELRLVGVETELFARGAAGIRLQGCEVELTT